MFISTCSQNLIDTIKGTSVQDNIEKEEMVIEEEIDRAIEALNDSLNMIVKSKPPPRPSIPTASDEKFTDENYEIFESGYENWEDWEAPPSRNRDLEFISYDKPPRPKPGREINPKYPGLAISMGLEGKVYIKFFIDKRGRVDHNKIKMIKGNPVFEKAAIDAVAQSKWEPAMQRDTKVGVWMTVPVVFKLKDANK